MSFLRKLLKRRSMPSMDSGLNVPEVIFSDDNERTLESELTASIDGRDLPSIQTHLYQLLHAKPRYSMVTEDTFNEILKIRGNRFSLHSGVGKFGLSDRSIYCNLIYELVTILQARQIPFEDIRSEQVKDCLDFVPYMKSMMTISLYRNCLEAADTVNNIPYKEVVKLLQNNGGVSIAGSASPDGRIIMQAREDLKEAMTQQEVQDIIDKYKIIFIRPPKGGFKKRKMSKRIQKRKLKTRRTRKSS